MEKWEGKNEKKGEEKDAWKFLTFGCSCSKDPINLVLVRPWPVLRINNLYSCISSGEKKKSFKAKNTFKTNTDRIETD